MPGMVNNKVVRKRMNVTKLSSRATRMKVGKYIATFRWAESVHHLYTGLFHDRVALRLMGRLARTFFCDLSIIIQEYALLKFCALIEPARTCGKDNLSLANLIQSIDWPSKERGKLENLEKKVNPFGIKILGARKKIIAHHDMMAYKGKRRWGVFLPGEDREFLMNIEAACKLMYEACIGDVFPDHYLAMGETDVSDFKDVLRSAAAWDKLVEKASRSPQYGERAFWDLLRLKGKLQFNSRA